MLRPTQFMKMIVIFMVISIYSVSSLAQTIMKTVTPQHSIPKTILTSEIRELNIGDLVPDFEIELINYSAKKARLSDFNGKYIILDFWASWCTSCLYTFPKLDSLQKKFGNEQLQVLLVNTSNTGDDLYKVLTFFEKHRNLAGEKYQLPSIINDTISEILFPHRMIPHYVMIDKNGIVLAITSNEQITQKNIEDFISGKQLTLPIKKDLDFDYTKPVFVNENGGKSEKYLYRSFLTEYLEGLPTIIGTNRDINKLVTRFYALNVSILMLYQRAYPELLKYSKNRIIMQVRDPLKYTKEGSWDNWIQTNTYGYELIIPPSSSEKFREYMQIDLQRFFGLKVDTKKRKVKCLIVKSYKKNDAVQIKMKDTLPQTNLDENNDFPKYIYNYPISALVNFLNYKFSVPVLNETNFFEKVRIEGLPKDFSDIKSLNAILKKYGFKIIEAKRRVEFLVLSERD